MKNVWSYSTLIIAVFFFTLPSWAAYDEIIFGSTHDYFKLERAGSGYSYKGKRVSLGTFAEFLPLFQQELGDACPQLPKKPTLTVKAKKGDTVQTRHFYLPQKIIRQGNNCIEVGGEGMFYIPLHRSWFKGKDSSSLIVNNSMEVHFPDNGVIAARKGKDGKWGPQDSLVSKKDWFVEWTFFDRFAESLSQYSIDARLHASAGKGRPHFKIKSGSRTYNFYAIGKNLWAVKSPRHNWLVASNSWSFWNDMSKDLFTDRHSANLKVVADSEADLKKRLGALDTVASHLSRATKHLLRDILLDPSENTELKLQMVKSLKQRPSMENMGILVEALTEASVSELQMAITDALRVRNPKGPTINEDTTEDERQQAVQTWQQWWKEQNNS